MSSADTELPDPETVLERARESTPDAADVHVVVAGTADATAVELTDEGYVGGAAGAVGRLAAVTASDAAVHSPEPDFTADGPWLVLAPLAGFVSTVSAGTGRATVTLDDVGPVTERIAALLDAARPRHDHYPVEDDDRGAFTRGMTTLALDSVSVGSSLTATFDVSTTPATRTSTVEARFDGLAGLEGVEYEPIVGVVRAAPSPQLRGAVEAAHRRVRGDCEYEWLPEPGVFAAIPSVEKVALGTGVPDADEFSRDQFRTCVELLNETISAFGGDP